MNRIRCWTDCPIVALGDAPGVEAPIRAAEALTYDGDKYSAIRVGGVIVEIKAGYLYAQRGRLGHVKPVPRKHLRPLPRRLPEETST